MPFRVYKASAGSGKTFTLVAEYLRLCLSSADPMAFKQVLAITFTNKAAGEMKTRIMEALAGLRDPENDAQRDLRNHLLRTTGLTSAQIAERSTKVLRAMLHNYGLIGISTIDRFTLRVIKGFAQDLGLPAKFEVSMNQDQFELQIVDMILDQVGTDPDLTNALVDLITARTEEEKSWRIEDLLKGAAKNVFNEDSRVRAEHFKDITWAQFADLRKRLSAYNRGFENEMKAFGKRGIELIQRNEIDEGSFARGGQGIGRYFLNLSELKAKTPWPNSYVEAFVNEDKWISGKCPDDQASAIESIAGELSQLVLDATQILSKKESTYKLYKVILDNLHVIGLLSAMKKCLDIIQDENDTVSISEFNHLINKQVMDHPAPFIYERLGNRYRHFLIDEFQDTSVLQWFNLLPLIDESLSKAGFCMVVGDGKQSIYRWRGGKVEQFNRLPKLVDENEKVHDDLQNALLKQREASISSDFRSIPLKQNFRSYNAIVDTNNRLFTYLSSDGQAAAKEVYLDADQNVVKRDREGLVVFAAVYGKKNEDREPIHLQNLERWVQECIGDGVPLGNMCVLVRKNQQAQMVAEHLLDLKVDVVSKEALAIQGSSVVRTVIGIAKFLMDPEDRINAATLIANYEQMGEGNASLLESFERSSDNLPAFIRERIFPELQIGSEEMILAKPVFQLFEYLTHKVAGSNSDPRVTFFLDMMLAFGLNDQADLTGALAHWEEKRAKAAIKMDDNANAVRIMTIHQSKGLQFPVVFHPFVQYKADASRNEIWADVDNEDLLPLTAIKAKANSHLAIPEFGNALEGERSRDELDRMNTYYVALTRAKERLYVSLDGENRADSLAFKTKTFLENEGWDPESETEFRIGEAWKEAIPTKEGPPSQSFKIQAPVFTDSPKLRVSRSLVKANWTDLSDSRQRGQLIHAILEQLETKNDIGLLEVDSRLSGLAESDRDQILSSVRSVVQHPAIQKWYTEGVEVMNEQELLLPDGTILRPDRISRVENEMAVIEYKTGNKRPEHEIQLRSYLQALAGITPELPKGFLVYTENLEVEEVTI